MLQRWLDQAEADWLQIDSEWGCQAGGLDEAVARGDEDTQHIRDMRQLLSDAD